MNKILRNENIRNNGLPVYPLLKTIHKERSVQFIITTFFAIIILGWFFLSFSSGSSFQINAGEQPLDSLAPINAVRLPFTVFILSNHTDHDVTISGINVISNNAAIEELILVDTLGFQIGSTKKPDAQGRTSVGDEFTIPAGETLTYTVAGNIADCESPCAHNKSEAFVEVVGLSTPSDLGGTLPIKGATHIINSDLKIGSIVTTVIGPNTMDNFSNNKNVILSNLRFTADGNEDVKLYSLRYKYSGTADRRALNNLNVKIDGTTGPAVWSSDGNYVTASFPGGILVRGGSSIDTSLQGDIAIDNSPGQTVQFDIETPSEVYFVGQIYGYGIPPKGSSPSSNRPWLSGPIFNQTIHSAPSIPSVI